MFLLLLHLSILSRGVSAPLKFHLLQVRPLGSPMSPTPSVPLVEWERFPAAAYPWAVAAPRPSLGIPTTSAANPPASNS